MRFAAVLLLFSSGAFSMLNPPGTSCVPRLLDGPAPLLESDHLRLARQLGFTRIRSGEVNELLDLERNGVFAAGDLATADGTADVEQRLCGGALATWRTEKMADVLPQFLIERKLLIDRTHWFFQEWLREYFRGALYFLPSTKPGAVLIAARALPGAVSCLRTGCSGYQLQSELARWVYAQSDKQIIVSEVEVLQQNPRGGVVFTALVQAAN